MSEKLKSFLLNDHIFFGLVIILVGLASFGLGRASVVPVANKSTKISSFEPNIPVLQAAVGLQATKTTPVANQSPILEELVASKSGTKYHLTSCGGAKQIKPENKIFFSSRTEAEAAGYKPAANCPGLQ